MTPNDARSPDAEYRQHLEAGRLTYQRCSPVGHSVFPPRIACPTCGSRDLAWTDSVGQGTVYSTTTISPRGVDPYAVILIDLDEGFRMMSRLDGPDALSVEIGDRVRTTIRTIGEGTEPQPCAEREASA